MDTNQELLLSAKRFTLANEDMKTKMYKDPLGFWTIGAGYCIEKRGLPLNVCNALYEGDMEYHLSKLNELLWFQALNMARKMVILDMSYNLGLEGILKFEHMIEAIKHKEWNVAAQEILDSKASHQLPERYQRNAEIMRLGTFPLPLVG